MKPAVNGIPAKDNIMTVVAVLDDARTNHGSLQGFVLHLRVVIWARTLTLLHQAPIVVNT